MLPPLVETLQQFSTQALMVRDRHPEFPGDEGVDIETMFSYCRITVIYEDHIVGMVLVR